MPDMKIVHVNDHYNDRGGVEQYLLAAGRLLETHGHQNVVVYRHQSETTIPEGAWPAYHLDGAPGAKLSAMLGKVIAAEQPDVAYLHHVSDPALAAAVINAMPTLAYVHGFAAVCPGLGKYFRRGDRVCTHPFGWGCIPLHYLRRCSAARRPSTVLRLLEQTRQLHDALLQAPRVLVAAPYMRSLLVQNGFPAPRIDILPPHFCAESEIPSYRPPARAKTLLFAGRLEVEKGLPYLLRALAGLPADVELVVAGDGALRAQYVQLAQRLGIAPRVTWAGWQSAAEMAAWYGRCAAVVIPSVCPEAFGKAGVEALAHGRPVVAFDVGGISSWLEPGVNGYLVTPADSDALARAIARLLDDPIRGEAMGRAGQGAVRTNYPAQQHLATLTRIFQEVMRGDVGKCSNLGGESDKRQCDYPDIQPQSVVVADAG
jgi:glycosyltransferase involved in cell wall biosynthesis